MPAVDDWDFDEPNKRIQHIDGRLSYSGNAGTAPAKYDWIRDDTSGAVGQIVGGDDLGGVSATGYFDLTSVVGQFGSTNGITVLDSVAFDTVNNSGFKVGDTIADSATRTLPVYAIEYNIPSDTVAGEGLAYGVLAGAGNFVDNEQIDISGGTTAVALVNTGAETVNSGLFGSAVVSGAGIDVPGTANTNDSVIINYDGTSLLAFPEDCKISDATSGATGFVQQVYGTATSGSIRLVDSNTVGGAWTDNNGIDFEDVVFWNAQVSGQVFKVGTVYTGETSGIEFRVVGIIDDADNTGKLITAGKTGGVTLNENINEKDTGTKIAQAESTVTILSTTALINIPNGVYDTQTEDEGGLFDSTRASLNIVRSANAFYTLVFDTFDELGLLDDDLPMLGDFKDLIYTIQKNYHIPDLSFRFLEKGAFQDTAQNNIWSNIQSLGNVADIGDHGFFYDTNNPRPRPSFYMELDGQLINQFWLPGHVNVNIKVKTSTDPKYITNGLESLGQLIGTGLPSVYNRDFGRTYSHTTVAGLGKVQVASINTASDADNTTGTQRIDYTSGSNMPFTIGEQIEATTSGVLKIAIVTASGSGASGDIDYVLKSGTDFTSADAITSSFGVSSATATASTTNTNLVAGYGTDIRQMTITDEIQGGTITTPGFTPGELVTQATTGATGYFMGVDSNNYMYCEKVNATAFSGNNNITGATGVYTVTSGVYDAAKATFLADLEDGSGEEAYTGYLAADITGANARTIADTYEWTKFLPRKESTTSLGGPGGTGAKEGRFYRSLNESTPFSEVPLAPFGTFSGGVMTGAQGNFIDKDELVAADLQNIALVNNAGTSRFPPNFQSLGIDGVIAGTKAMIGRTATLGSASSPVDFQRTEFKVGTVGSGNNQAADTTILIAAQDRTVSPTPSDVPSTGTLRILDPSNTGRYLSFDYSSVNRTTNIFTLASGDIQAVTGTGIDLVLNDNVHVVFVEEAISGNSANNTVQYVADIFVKATGRLKGYKEYVAYGTFVSTGFTFGAVMPADPTVNLP